MASTLGGHGQLHAIRKELYPFPPSETINDDYVIPLSVLSRGFRAVYEPAAMVWEEAQEMTGFARRIRIMAGNLQQLRQSWPAISAGLRQYAEATPEPELTGKFLATDWSILRWKLLFHVVNHSTMHAARSQT